MAKPNLDALMDEINKHESAGERSKRLLRENPTLAIGLTGAGLILLNQARNFKNRGSTRISNYLIYTRMYVQGFLVCSLTLGIGWEVGRYYYKKWNQPQPALTNEETEK